ncbi:MAG: nucleoside recognition domain-containing protein [Verrucomicrobiia bacterium]
MLNYIWLGLILVAVLVGGFNGRLKEMVSGTADSAGGAVTLAIGLIGIMALWLGLMRLAEKAGLIQTLARFLRPVLRWLFPGVPADHPAMGSMLMNIAANMLGLNNAATPLGLRAMRDLETMNRTPGTATNAMCTFLALNTSSVQLIPITAVGILAAAKSTNPSAIIGTAFFATLCAATTAIVAVKTLEKLPVFRAPIPPDDASAAAPAPPQSAAAAASSEPVANPLPPPMVAWGPVVLAGFVACFVWFFLMLVNQSWFGPQPAPVEVSGGLLVRIVNALSLLAIPFLLGFFPLYAALHRVPVYEEFVEGAKEGFNVALRIIPFLVAMLVAIGVFRNAGVIDLLTRLLQPALDLVQFPPEILPLALMRPLSGSASLGFFSELVREHGADSLIARTAGTLYGSTETTFYVVAVYFGSVNVKRTRHAIPAGLLADAAGAVAAVVICRMAFG